MKAFAVILFMCAHVLLSAQYETSIYVSQNGSGDYVSIQAAVDAAKSFPDKRITIYISAGIYEEKVHVEEWNSNLTLKGEDPLTTIIRWHDHFEKIDRGRNSTFHTATLTVRADNFRAENLTIENTAGPVGQAIALSLEADRVIIENCRITGHQDTLFADGANARQYFRDCYIEGTTDFIFGGATALFEDCIIHSLANSFITAASTPRGRKYGFVFLNCSITAETGIDSVYLGRPWRDYAKTVFIGCELGSHIRRGGWDNWSTPSREKTAFYAEYDNSGPGSDISGRVPWSHRLTKAASKDYSRQKILQPFTLPSMITE